MRITHNIPALTAYNALNSTNKALNKSIQRLSTGLRINSAADDAAGLAISEKMRAQTSGLNQAINNSEDGISLLQTAEGALESIQSILQRIRELSVQAANGTLTAQDRSYIQQEIDQLRTEVDNIANTTQFNGKRLLNGSSAGLWSSDKLSTKAYINGSLIDVDSFGQKSSFEGNYKIQIDADPGQAQVQKTNIFTTVSEDIPVYTLYRYAVATGNLEGPVMLGKTITVSVHGQSESITFNPVTCCGNVIEQMQDKGVLDKLNEKLAAAGHDGRVVFDSYGTLLYNHAFTFAYYTTEKADLDVLKFTSDAPNNVFTLTSSAVQSVEIPLRDKNNNNAEVRSALLPSNTLNATNMGNLSGKTITINIDDKSANITFGASDVASDSDVLAAIQKGIEGLGISAELVANKIVLSAVTEINKFNENILSVTGDVAGTPFENMPKIYDHYYVTNITFSGEPTRIEPAEPTQAAMDTKLSDIFQFYTSEGVCVLTDPQTITITQGNGKSTKVTLYATDTIKDVRDKLNDAIANGLGQDQYVDNANNFVTFVTAPTDNGLESVAGTFVIRSAVTGSEGELHFSGNEDVLNALSLNEIQKVTESEFTAYVTDAHTGETLNGGKITGNKLLGVIHENVDVEFDLMSDMKATWNNNARSFDIKANTGVYKTIVHLAENSLVFQTGANEGNDFVVSIGDMSAKALGIDKVIVTDRESAGRAITILDNAITKVSAQRSKIGAYQNRLEYKISNLTTMYTNLTEAESRIRDADMSKEMMNFVKLQILNQSGTAMLGQANQLPQSVMSLIL